jgi:hypothetical protein
MKSFQIFLLFMVLTIWAGLAFGSKYHNSTTNNVTNNHFTEETTITSGVSDKDLAEALSLAYSMNFHFDMATYDWQAGVTGAIYDDENAVSFGLAKRFQKMDALWHIAAGQNGSNEALVGGVVFRF